MGIWKRIYNAITGKADKPKVTYVNRDGSTMAERLGIADRRAIELQAQGQYLLNTPPRFPEQPSAVHLGARFDVDTDNEMFYLTWWCCSQNSKYGPIHVVHAVPQPSLN
jgi:hypothetical protein